MHLSKDEMADVMQRVFKECDGLRGAGQKEYAGGDNALGNFLRIATETGATPEQVLWTYAMKHKDGIAAHIRGHRSQREPVQGRINDLIVYLCLLRGMVETREKAVMDEFTKALKTKGTKTGRFQAKKPNRSNRPKRRLKSTEVPRHPFEHDGRGWCRVCSYGRAADCHRRPEVVPLARP